MSKPKFTYNLKLIFGGIIVGEILFWFFYFVLKNTLGLTSENGEQLFFNNENALHFFWLLLPIIGIYAYNVWSYNKNLSEKNPEVIKHLVQPVSSMSSFLKFFFLRNAIVLTIFTMAQPIFGEKKVAGTSESLELAIALDISNSMNTCDIDKKTSRLAIAKRSLVQLINNLGGEKIGICLFANSAFVQLPLTSDYRAAKLFINDIETNLISSQGTNIKAAIEVTEKMFSEENVTKGIVLITDGENHEENPDYALKSIKEKQIQLVVLGIGTKKGGVIPKIPNKPELGYKKSAMGRPVISKIDESFLQSIASKADGHAEVSSEEFPNLSGLLTQIKQMKRMKIDTFEFDAKQERYQYPLFLAIVCWVLFLLWTKNIVSFTDKWS